MTSFKCDAVNNDLVIENNDFVMVEGIDEVVIMVKNRLKTYFGEWFLDTSIGVPYFQEILVKNPSPSRVEQLIRDTITETPGVIELLEFELDISDPVTRELSVRAKIKGNNGIIELFEILGAS